MDDVTNSGRDLPIEDDDGEEVNESDGFGQLEDHTARSRYLQV